MKRNIKKYSMYILMTLIFCAVFSIQVSAEGIDIAGPIQDAWNNYVVSNIKGVMAVAFTAISAILLIILITRLVTIGVNYKSHTQQEIEWIPLVVILICLVLSTTASVWMWTMVPLEAGVTAGTGVTA